MENPSLLCLVLLLSVVNNFQLIISFSFNYIAVIIVCVAFESSVINLTWTKKHHFTIFFMLNSHFWFSGVRTFAKGLSSKKMYSDKKFDLFWRCHFLAPKMLFCGFSKLGLHNGDEMRLKLRKNIHFNHLVWCVCVCVCERERERWSDR